MPIIRTNVFAFTFEITNEWGIIIFIYISPSYWSLMFLELKSMFKF